MGKSTWYRISDASKDIGMTNSENS